jgi:DNA repair protein RecO (recombination protein O)
MPANKEYKTTAITLKTFDLGEADRIISLFSKEHGIIKAVAKGVKKINSKYGGSLDLLNVNELVIRHGRNLETIIHCDSCKSFPMLRQDYDKLIYALFLGELILLFSNEGEPVQEVFDLLIYTLDIMQYSENPLWYAIWFEMHLLTILGYQANLESCDICQEIIPERDVSSRSKLGFSLITGSIICENCLRLTANYKLITDEIRNILIKLKTFDLEKISGASPDEATLRKTQDILKEYFSNLSERKIKTLSVFDSASQYI